MPRTLPALLLCLVLPAMVAARTVTYNTKTGKYHDPSCASAIRCTVNCVDIPLKEAKSSGGVPCKKCHGGGR